MTAERRKLPMRPAAARFRRLVALEDARLRRLFGMQLARILAVLVTLVALMAMFGAASDGGRSRAASIVHPALTWLTWLVGGCAALSAARDFKSVDEREGIAALTRLRGFDEAALEPARAIAVVSRIARLIAVPALLLALIGLLLSKSLAEVGWRALLCVAVVSYALLVGAVLGAVARWAALMSPRHGRSLLISAIVVPALLSSVWPAVPSLPALLDALNRAFRVLGAAT